MTAEDDEWEAVMKAVDAWESSEEVSKRGLAEETGLSRGTIRRVVDRIKKYRALDEVAKIGWQGRLVWPDETEQLADD